MQISGGLTLAFDRIRAVGGTALQIFTRNQRQWRVPPLSEADIAAFRVAWTAWGDYPVAAHDSYLINLATPDAEAAERSIQGFATELTRAERLGLGWLVTHPGACLDGDRPAGLRRYAERLDRAIDLAGTDRVTILLENTSGQGTVLGANFREIGSVLALSRHPERLGLCLDTCHAFAAGYDLADDDGYAATVTEIDAEIGLDRLGFMHLNDSMHGPGSRKDRHADIGAGTLGLRAFELIMTDARLLRVPKVIETPKDDGPERDIRNLDVLRSLIRQSA